MCHPHKKTTLKFMQRVAKSYRKKQAVSSHKRSLKSNSENTCVEDARATHRTHRLFRYWKCEPHSQGRSEQSPARTSGTRGSSAGAPALPSDPQIPPGLPRLGEEGTVGEDGGCPTWLPFLLSRPARSSLSCMAGSGRDGASSLSPHGAN